MQTPTRRELLLGSAATALLATGAGAITSGQMMAVSGGLSSLGTVSNLAALIFSDTVLYLRFTPAVGATSHQYRLNGGTATTLAGNKQITGLTAATVYTVEVRGVGVNGNGAWSNLVTVTTLAASVLYEDFESIGGALATGQALGTGASTTVDATWKVHGTNSVLVAPTAGSTNTTTVGFDKRPAGTFDPSTFQTMAFALKVVDRTSLTSCSVSIDTTNGAGGASQQVTFNEAASVWPGSILYLALDIPTSMPTVNATPACLVRYQFKQSGTLNSGRSVNFDAAFRQSRGRSKVTINFDDGYYSQLLIAAPYLQAKGLTATLHVEYANLAAGAQGTAYNSRLNAGSVTTLHSAPYNWQICSQANGTDVTTLGSTANAVAAFDGVKANIIANGWNDNGSENHVSWPNGAWNQSIVDAMKAAGYLSVRGVQQFPYYTRFGFDDRVMAYPSYGMSWTNSSTYTTAATMLAALDAAIATGSDWNIHIHYIGTASTNGAIGTVDAEFYSLIDGIASRVSQGKCDVVSTTDWYAAGVAGAIPA